MKKLKFLSLLFICSGVLLFSGCAEDEDTDPKPTINFIGGTGYTSSDITLCPGETFKVGINASENVDTKSNLDEFTVERGSANEVDSNISGTSFTWEQTLTASSLVGSETWTFSVTDNAGETASLSFVVTTESFTEKTGYFFYHIEGSLHGAFDLVQDATVAASGADANKDMKNTDAAAAPFTGSWTAGNSTTFIKDNSYPYASANPCTAKVAFDAGGTPAGSVTDPNVDDVYIAKLRGGTDYAVIKITEVNPNDNTCACGNTGKITFSYKK